jgi:RNA polymerase sigma-70 factor (ECF subfamily)
MTDRSEGLITAATIETAARGEEEAQRRIYEAYYSAAFRLAFLLLGDVGDAEEVAQDSFVYALGNLWRYDPERGALWTWLRVIVVSRARNKRRRRQLALVPIEVLSGPARPLYDAGPRDPARCFELASARRAVWDALMQVSPGARDALILRYYEGLSYREISQALGCSPEAARSRVAHGKVQLRRLLADGEAEVAPLTLGFSSSTS